MLGFNPVPKPSHRRRKPTSKMRGKITPEVYHKALERSGGRCERCGKGGHLEAAHLIRRWKIEKRTTENDIAMLCGPVVNTGTCHNWVDYTEKGREWAAAYREQLYERGKDNERNEGASV